MAERVLNRASKKALIEFLVESLKLEEEQAEIFVESRDLELKKREIADKLDKELATKDFVRAEFSKLDKKFVEFDKKLVELDKKFTIYFIVVIATIIITSPNALDLIQRIFGLVK